MRDVFCPNVKQARFAAGSVSQTVLPAVMLLVLTAVWIIPAAAAVPQLRTSFCETGIQTQPTNPQTSLTVEVAVNEIIGNKVTAYATLTDDDGSAIVAAPVNFYIDSQDSTLEWVGHAITDCDGVAIIRFTRETSGSIEITAKFEGSKTLIENQVKASLVLKQLATEESTVISTESLGVIISMLVSIAVALIGAALLATVAVQQDKRDALLQK